MWRRPHLARRLAKLSGKLFEFSLDFIPLKAPRRDIAVDINRSSISTVQSGAGDLDRPTSTPVLKLFLCSLTPWCSACAATHKMGRRRARDWSQAFTLWLPSKVAMLNIGPPRLRAEWLYRPFSNFLRRDGKRSESPIGIPHRNRSQPLNCALEACASSHTKARSRRLTSDWPPIRRACLNHCNAGCLEDSSPVF
jgi:hypothetical protein